ncbi:hypothetical protein SOVF_179830 isoform B [Spinacia oleracea]|uniref:Large ribosomal subunit protein uL22c n=1 Tax=Spinacia oleracea TaxID=3562 RepID=A0A9R0J5W5_SPIOL|nr:uncharacterized protein LOC110800273 isoform X2 [Spinacia oleracea]KNA06564.1 hypothetical protein SOVF_179830 isoform B [Spinacia oleracea]
MATLRSIGGKCRALLAAANSSTTASTAATGAAKRSKRPFSAASNNNTRGILVSPTLSDLVGSPNASRIEALNKIWNYIKLHNLQGISTSRILLADATPISSPLIPISATSSGTNESQTENQAVKPKPEKVQAILKGIKQSPKKVNLVAALIRGMRVEDALLQLQVTVKRASKTVYQVVHSARANAVHNHGLDPDRLLVAEAFVGKGFFKKRLSYHAKMRHGIIMKPECRLTVVVRELTSDEEAEIARLRVHNFKKLSKREHRLVPHKLIESTPVWGRKNKTNSQASAVMV